MDELKQDAEVDDLLITHHVPRVALAEGEERARGGSEIEGWMDAGWYLTKDRDDRRALRAMGRDVELEAIDLNYSPGPRRLQATGQTRDERREADGIQRVVDALALILEDDGDRPKTGDLEEKIEGDKNERSSWIRAAVREEYIVRERSRGAKLCDLTEKGRKLRERRVGLPRKADTETDA